MPLPSQHRFPRWFRIGQWFIIPVLVLLIGELYVRARFTTHLAWYQEAEQKVRAQHVDYLFLGSSRVAGGIDVPAFERVMSQHLGKPVHALNLGLAWATPVEHYFGLRRLFRSAPANLAGCVVFWEAPGKILDLGNWRDPWVNSDQPQLILQVLQPHDLRELWHSPAAMETKLNLTVKLLLRPSALFTQRSRVRERLGLRGEEAVARLLSLQRTAPAPAPLADLASVGGIRADAVGVALSRTTALPFTEGEIRSQRLCTNWNTEVYADMARLVEQHHGRIVLYHMPESTVFERVFQTEIGRKNQQTFQEQFASLHTVMLEPAFPYNDDDFPDLWHLRKSRAAEFTTALAQSFIQSTAAP